MAIRSKRRQVGDTRLAAAYHDAMTTQKVSVTLESTAIARAREAAGPRGLSAYLDAALEEKLARDERRQVLLDWLAELETVDPTPPDVQARARKRAARIRALVEE
jgi:hypothetical protein